ncbi:MAG: UDP-N-acetylmuramate dehydrogenase [Actinomycetota bacterium]
MSEPLARAESILRAAAGDRVRTAFPLAPLTSFRLGGPAALYLEPESDADLAAAGEAIVAADVPFVVIGKGSNILVSDAGFQGLVLRLGRGYRWVAREGERLTAGGSIPLPALAGVALRHGLAGLEFGVAIPATLGGAIRMNAGAHGGAMADVLERILTYRLRDGRAETVPVEDAGFAYRRSALVDDAVVTGGVVRLGTEDATEIRARMEEARGWRRRTQPLAEPNCGSVFTNPEGDHAARLIARAGGKGRRVGGASVSLKHANFIVAEPGARSSDVLALIRDIQRLVEDTAGIALEPEVKLIGAFDDVRR